MKRSISLYFVFLCALPFFLTNCKPTDNPALPLGPTAYRLNYPAYFSVPNIPTTNPTTIEGVALGRKLFYDSILSGDNSQSCGSCHNQDFSFTDNALQFSKGIDKIMGNRNSMSIINLAWDKAFFWDGRAKSLEEQALGPVENPIEMHEDWANAVLELANHPTYPALFEKAFETPVITKERVAKAIAQFERTMISSNSLFDREYLSSKMIESAVTNPKNTLEMGMKLFYGKADCWHCHGAVGDFLFTDRAFHNNGLDSLFQDKGQELVTKNSMDRGKFKTPTLRNVEVTGPYMHDGRFKTIDEVIEFYNSGVKKSPSLDPNMKELAKGLNLTNNEKAELKEFLLSLTDYTFLSNPDFKKQ